METWPLTSSREVYAGAMDSCWSLRIIVIDGLALGRIRFILLWVPARLAGEYSMFLCVLSDLGMHQVKLPGPTQGSFK